MSPASKNSSLILCALAVGAVAALLDAGALYFLSAFLFMIPVSSRLFGVISLRSLSTIPLSAAPAPAGDIIELPVEIRNGGRMPRFNIRLELDLPFALGPVEGDSWSRDSASDNVTSSHLSSGKAPSEDPASGDLASGNRSLSDSEAAPPVAALEPASLDPAAPTLPEGVPASYTSSNPSQTKTEIPMAPGRGTTLARCAVRARQRGVFEVGPARITHMDPLKLSTVSRSLPFSQEAIAYPRPLGVSLAALLGGDMMGSERTARSRGAVDGSDFYGIRPYRTGDEWRRIHWPTTARTGSLMVIEREALASLSLAIVLDAAAPGGENPEAPLEVLIRLAAQLAEEAVRRMSVLSLFLLREDGSICRLLDRCKEQTLAMDALARVDPAAPQESFPAQALPSLIGPGPSIAMLTDRLDERVSSISRVASQSSWPGAIIVLDTPDFKSGASDGRPGSLPVWRLALLSQGGGYHVEPLDRL